MSDKKKFRAGVLFGDEVKEVLDYAKANEFALPAVNCVNTNSVNASLAAGREVNSPMMIQFSNGGAQFFIGKGVSKENQLGPILGGIAGAKYADAAAKAYGVPLILNTDHCAKKLLPWVDGMLAAKSSSPRPASRFTARTCSIFRKSRSKRISRSVRNTSPACPSSV